MLLICFNKNNYFFLWKLFCRPVSAAALHACLCGSFPSGRSHLPLPSFKSGDSLHLLPGRLHHPSFHEPGHLWISGRAVQEVLGPVPDLSEPMHRPGQTAVAEGEPVGEMTTSGFDWLPVDVVSRLIDGDSWWDYGSRLSYI